MYTLSIYYASIYYILPYNSMNLHLKYILLKFRFVYKQLLKLSIFMDITIKIFFYCSYMFQTLNYKKLYLKTYSLYRSNMIRKIFR